MPHEILLGVISTEYLGFFHSSSLSPNSVNWTSSAIVGIHFVVDSYQAKENLLRFSNPSSRQEQRRSTVDKKKVNMYSETFSYLRIEHISHTHIFGSYARERNTYCDSCVFSYIDIYDKTFPHWKKNLKITKNNKNFHNKIREAHLADIRERFVNWFEFSTTHPCSPKHFIVFRQCSRIKSTLCTHHIVRNTIKHYERENLTFRMSHGKVLRTMFHLVSAKAIKFYYAFVADAGFIVLWWQMLLLV